ncbi:MULTISPECIES: hypothetical protein [Streptomyces]|uniref:hypothetical protein n=1 Tax=Streptomyces TaxID=1883 RepID=UPI000B9DE4EE|nr:hypothetical protein [Streptomyces kasugaensis]
MTTTTETTTAAGEPDAADSPTPIKLRAYLLPNRRFAADLCTGSAYLLKEGGAWLVGAGIKEFGTRLGYTALGGYVALYAAHTAPQIVMPTASLGWCAAALLYSRSPTPDQEGGRAKRWLRDRKGKGAEAPKISLTKSTDPDHEDGQGPELEKGVVEPDLDMVVRLVRHLADRGPGQRPHQGAHLDDLIDTGELGDWDKDTLKDALTEWGIPVEEKGFKLTLDGRQRVRQGVRVGDLPHGTGEGPQHPPAGPPSRAGEAAPEPLTHHPPAPPSPAPPQPPAQTPAEGAVEGAANPSPRPAPAPSPEGPVGR